MDQFLSSSSGDCVGGMGFMQDTGVWSSNRASPTFSPICNLSTPYVTLCFNHIESPTLPYKGKLQLLPNETVKMNVQLNVLWVEKQ